MKTGELLQKVFTYNGSKKKEKRKSEKILMHAGEDEGQVMSSVTDKG